MTIGAGLKPEGGPERSPIAGAGAPSGVDAGPKRYSVQGKMAVVARLLRGESLEVIILSAPLRSSTKRWRHATAPATAHSKRNCIGREAELY